MFTKVLSLAIVAAALAVASPAMAQTTPPPAPSEAAPEPQGKIVFEETSKDFGEINQGDKVSHTFKFRNAGTAPVIITKVLTTCGCTASEYTKEPVLPGKTGIIKATFDSKGKHGIQNKVLSVLSNASNNDEHLTLRVNVISKTGQ